MNCSEPALKLNGRPFESSPRYSAEVTRIRSVAISTLSFTSIKLISLRLRSGAITSTAASAPMKSGKATPALTYHPDHARSRGFAQAIRGVTADGLPVQTWAKDV